jgi:hypothetical protein
MLHSKQFSLSILLSFILFSSAAFTQVEKLHLKNQSPTYKEVIQFYTNLADRYDYAKLFTYGTSDAGLPLHLFVIDYKKEFRPNSKRAMLLIMNDIHAGEPCGVNASMLLTKNMLESGKIPEKAIIGIIPIYNIGGALNRNSETRTNQDGPMEYGFRGNAKNLDLNRDFIKNDSKNAQAFTEIFHLWKPQLFVDTHTSNGADYQYSFTLIATQKDKLSPVLKPFLTDKIEPFLYTGMKQKGYEMSPYVSPFDKVPENGIKAFMDYPHYSTGYTALFNTIGFTTEAHMLKPFSERVEATRTFLSLLISFTNKNADEVVQYRRMANRMMVNSLSYDVDWKLNDTIYKEIKFKGYEAAYKKSLISGKDRLYYDRSKAYEKMIPYYGTYIATQKVKRPKYYVIPQAYDEVIKRLQDNKVLLNQLKRDTLIRVKEFYINSYNTTDYAYEGHYLHSNVKVSEKMATHQFYKGDYIVPMGQVSDYYTLTVLDPRSVDSFFAWNFFDPILQQKEWYSAYVFEDEAVEILNADPELQKEFNEMKKNDPVFREDGSAQLYFIYTHSKHFEKAHMLYPVYRVD